jgi:uncharacterized LabA/DUF88 family protein
MVRLLGLSAADIKQIKEMFGRMTSDQLLEEVQKRFDAKKRKVAKSKPSMTDGGKAYDALLVDENDLVQYLERGWELVSVINSLSRNQEAHTLSDLLGYAKRTVQSEKDVEIQIDLKTVNGKQTAVIFSSDIELSELAKSLIMNWLHLKHGLELPDGKCVIRTKLKQR